MNKNDAAVLTRLDKEIHLELGQHKYIYNGIQNELIELMGKQVLQRNLNQFVRVIFWNNNEDTDISNKELLSMCFRWIKDLRVNEDFVGYYELSDIKSDTTLTAIKDPIL